MLLIRRNSILSDISLQVTPCLDSKSRFRRNMDMILKISCNMISVTIFYHVVTSYRSSRMVGTTVKAYRNNPTERNGSAELEIAAESQSA